MTVTTLTHASAAGTFSLPDGRKLHRLGFGAMRITGDGIWGPPDDRDAAHHLLKKALSFGVNLFDTADSYGPCVSEELIAEALYPYPEDMIIATKGGLIRPGPDHWEPDGRPTHLREACEGSLRRLKLDCIDLYQLHTVDPKVPLEDSLGALIDLQRQGKIRHIGLSNVRVEHIARARRMVPIVSVQNRYNLTDRKHEAVVDYCAREGIAFIPWYPLATGALAKPTGPVARIAAHREVHPSQVALAWLLQRSPVMLPIPGTSSIEHLEQNVGAAALRLRQDEMDELTEAVPAG